MDDLSDKISNFLKDPENLEKIKSLTSMLGGSGGESAKEEHHEQHTSEDNVSSSKDDIFSSLDPDMLMKFSNIMRKTNDRDDKRINLLLALKPYLCDKRKEKMESAMKMIKFSKMAAILGENFKF